MLENLNPDSSGRVHRVPQPLTQNTGSTTASRLAALVMIHPTTREGPMAYCRGRKLQIEQDRALSRDSHVESHIRRPYLSVPAAGVAAPDEGVFSCGVGCFFSPVHSSQAAWASAIPASPKRPKSRPPQWTCGRSGSFPK